MTEWTAIQDSWIRDVSDSQLLEVIKRASVNYELDENLGDTTERIESILWAASRGELGYEWGIIGVYRDGALENE